jgi:endonuclease/exonuclease/phosphatase (EEP) superfamily protein YafD
MKTSRDKRVGLEKARNVVSRLANLFGALAIAGTLLGFAARYSWVADFAVHMRVQYAILLLPTLAVWARSRKYKLAIIGVVALLLNVWPLIPYLLPIGGSLSTRGVVDLASDTFRLQVVNVLRTNDAIDATLQDVVNEDADFVYLMEVSGDWEKRLESLLGIYPYQKLICRNDYTGVAFLSKRPWEKIEVVDTGDSNPPLDILFTSDGFKYPFRIVATHPLPPFGAALTESRDRQLCTLAERCNSKVATLMVGDFNLTPWSPRFKNVLDCGGLRDASRGYGISPTLAPLPTLMGGLRVDHVLISEQIQIINYRLGVMAYSDHRSVMVEFRIGESGAIVGATP